MTTNQYTAGNEIETAALATIIIRKFRGTLPTEAEFETKFEKFFREVSNAAPTRQPNKAAIKAAVAHAVTVLSPAL